MRRSRLLPKDPIFDEAVGGVVATPFDVRPIGLKNAVVKAAASLANRPLARLLAQQAHPDQRGFVVGRQLTANIVEIDAVMRRSSLRWAAGGRDNFHCINLFWI